MYRDHLRRAIEELDEEFEEVEEVEESDSEDDVPVPERNARRGKSVGKRRPGRNTSVTRAHGLRLAIAEMSRAVRAFDDHPEEPKLTSMRVRQLYQLSSRIRNLLRRPATVETVKNDAKLLTDAIFARDRATVEWLVEEVGAELHTSTVIKLNGRMTRISPLIAAFGDLSMLDYLLAHGIDLDRAVGETDPYYAAFQLTEHREAVVDRLIAAGGRVDACIGQSKTPRLAGLFHCRHFSKPLFDRLWERCESIEVEQLLTMALCSLDPSKEGFFHLLDRGLIGTKIETSDGRTLLHLLPLTLRAYSEEVSEKIFRMLIRDGVNLDQPNANGHTPLHQVAIYYSNQSEFLRWYLEAGADPTARTAKGGTVADCYLSQTATWVKPPSIAGLDTLLDAGAKMTVGVEGRKPALFHYLAAWPASRVKPEQTIEYLTALKHRGVDLADTHDGWTSAAWAALKGHNPTVIEWLVEQGSVLEHRDAAGVDRLLPSLFAVKYPGGAPWLRSLIPWVDSGVALDAVDADGKTSLRLIYDRRQEMKGPGLTMLFNRLIEAGADPTIPAKDGYTVLDLLTDQEWVGVTQLITRNNTDRIHPAFRGFLEYQKKRSKIFTEENCVICTDRPAGVMYTPCGHRCVCERCAISYHEKCPICQTLAQRLIVVTS